MSQRSENERRSWFMMRIKDKAARDRDAKHRERAIQSRVDYRFAMRKAMRYTIDGGLKFFAGSRRWGFLLGKFSFKFPALTSFVGMIAGFREQQEERYWWCSESGTRYWGQPYLNEILWADRFGFIQISYRCAPVLDEIAFEADLEAMEKMFKVSTIKGLGDQHIDNFGYTHDGRLVYIDYGFFNGMGDCYLGCPNGFSLMRWINRLAFNVEKKVRLMIGDTYSVRMNRVENERCISEGVKEYDSLWEPTVEATRLMVQEHCAKPLMRCVVKRVLLARDATYATQCITADSRGRNRVVDPIQYWNVSYVAGGPGSNEDVTEITTLRVRLTALGKRSSMPDIEHFVLLTSKSEDVHNVTGFLAQHGFPLGGVGSKGIKVITSHLGDMQLLKYGRYVGISDEGAAPEIVTVGKLFDHYYTMQGE